MYIGPKSFVIALDRRAAADGFFGDNQLLALQFIDLALKPSFEGSNALLDNRSWPLHIFSHAWRKV